MLSNSTHHAFWLQQQKNLKTRYPQLVARVKTDVAIIGGGITGLSTALELLERGYKVAVLEALVIGAGTTGASTGHLDAHPESGPSKFVKEVGLEGAQAVVAARKQAIERIAGRATPACDLRRIPAYYYTDGEASSDSKAGDPPPRHASREEMQRDMQAAIQLGLEVEWSEFTPLPRAGFGYRVEGMARMNSLAYVQHLASLVAERGGQVFENTFTCGPDGEHPTDMEVCSGSIEFDHVVNAVHCNYSDVLRTYFQTPPYQSYVVAVRVEGPPPDALFWDTTNPYYYTRLATSSDPQLIIVGGCDRRTGAHDSQESYDALLNYVRARWTVREVVTQWSAELFEPVDYLPIIGKLPGKDNVWIATGLSGVGLTWGTAAGDLLARQISGNATPLDDLLNPSRWALDSLPEYVSEQSAAFANYAERLLPAQRFDSSNLVKGEGKVGVVEGQHVAACRDRDGCLHHLNPICTHMGGVVHWNEAEQTWDCPVHGGRFRADGTRLYGPPSDGLKAVELPARTSHTS